MNIVFTLLLGLPMGIAFGYVSNRGKFCMNSGFRNLWMMKDTSIFKAYILAIAVQMLILPLLQYLGLIKLSVPVFYPLGAVLGGFIFGMAMNWSGGCAAGVWYKAGSGSIGAFLAVTGLIIGYVTTENGALKSVRVLIQSAGQSANMKSMTLSSLTNLPLFWISIPLSVILIFFIFKDSSNNPEKGWHWKKTGLWIGIVGVIAWVSSSLSGRYFGMAIMPGSEQTHDLLASGSWTTSNWDLFFVMGIPIGSYLSVARFGLFKWSNISSAAIWKFPLGGFVLGSSASLAGGCTVGHSLTGIPLLSIGSITFTICAICGAWMGVIINNKSRRL